MLGAIAFSVALALFLAACAIVHFLNEPSDDPFGNTAHGDIAFIAPDHLESLARVAVAQDTQGDGIRGTGTTTHKNPSRFLSSSSEQGSL